MMPSNAVACVRGVVSGDEFAPGAGFTVGGAGVVGAPVAASGGRCAGGSARRHGRRPGNGTRYAARMFATLAGAYPDADVRPEPVARERLLSILRDQLDAGLGMLSDGRVHDAVAEGAAIVDAWTAADEAVRQLVLEDGAGLEPPLVKVCVVGPYTLGRGADGPGAAAGEVTGRSPSSGPSAAGPSARRRRRTLAAAEELNGVIGELFRAGAPVVQVGEDALAHLDAAADRELALVRDALSRLTRDLDGHVSLAVSGGNADRPGPALFFDPPFASYLFDLVAGPDNWRLIAVAPGDRGIICGVADARSRTRDDRAVMVWAARYAAALGGRGPQRVGLAPSAGLEILPRDVARAKLAALAEAARAAGLPDEELKQVLDPRAVDMRSAALGRYDPSARPGRRRSGR